MQERRTGSHLASSDSNGSRKKYRSSVSVNRESRTEEAPRATERHSRNVEINNVQLRKERIVDSERENQYADSFGNAKKKKLSKAKKAGLIILALAVFFGVVGLGTVMLIIHGPSEQAKIMFVRTFTDTATLKKLPTLFMPQSEVDAIADPSYGVEEIPIQYQFESAAKQKEVVISEEVNYENVIEYFDITGPSYHGKMILVHDPSLVRLGTPVGGRSGYYGQTLTVKQYCEEYGAIAGITGAGFDMENNVPAGMVINNGELLFGDLDEYDGPTMILTNDNKLVLGYMTPREMLENDARIGLCWWPHLIIDGVKQTGLGGGFSSRCAIGQTADGTIILVVTEGRMISSFGATLDDIADLMEKYGAVNAINLDSGRSAVMVYEGENVTKVAIGSGVGVEERALPNCFLVMPEGWSENED